MNIVLLESLGISPERLSEYAVRWLRPGILLTLIPGIWTYRYR